MSTWFARAEGCTVPVTVDGSIIHGVLFGIQNDSEAEVEVRNIDVEIAQDPYRLVAATQYVQRITALSGGTALSVAKLDTSAASLPSQVKVVKSPAGYTLSDVLGVPGQMSGVLPDDRLPSSRNGGRWGAMESCLRRVAAVEGLVLREGEGLVLHQEASGGAHTQYVRVVVKNTSSGATYSAEALDVPTAEQGALIALFNGSGSGVVLEVQAVESVDIGHVGDGGSATFPALGHILPGLRLVSCASLSGGETVSPFARDTSASALPSGIVLKRGAHAVYAEAVPTLNVEVAAASATNYEALQFLQRQSCLRGVNWPERITLYPDTVGAPMNLEGPRRKLFDSFGAATGYVLKHGEALAILHWHLPYDAAINAVTYAAADQPITRRNCNITIEFNVTTGEGKKIASARPLDATIIG